MASEHCFCGDGERQYRKLPVRYLDVLGKDRRKVYDSRQRPRHDCASMCAGTVTWSFIGADHGLIVMVDRRH